MLPLHPWRVWHLRVPALQLSHCAFLATFRLQVCGALGLCCKGCTEAQLHCAGLKLVHANAVAYDDILSAPLVAEGGLHQCRSVQDLAKEVQDRDLKIHALANNAGGGWLPWGTARLQSQGLHQALALAWCALCLG